MGIAPATYPRPPNRCFSQARVLTGAVDEQGTEAERRGLVLQATEDPLAAADEMATRIGRQAPLAVRAAVRAMRLAQEQNGGGLDAALRREADVTAPAPTTTTPLSFSPPSPPPPSPLPPPKPHNLPPVSLSGGCRLAGTGFGLRFRRLAGGCTRSAREAAARVHRALEAANQFIFAHCGYE